MIQRRALFLLLLLTSFAAAQTKLAPPPAAPARIRVTLDPAASKTTLSGRLLVFMTRGSSHGAALKPDDMDPNAVWIAGADVHDLVPGKPIEFSPEQSFPSPFAEMKPGRHAFMALLDPDHSYTYDGLDSDDIYSEVVVRRYPAAGPPVELTLKRRVPPPDLHDTDTLKYVDFPSPMLTKFWGRPITMHALVLLPPGYAKGGSSYPVSYHVHGFDGRYWMAAEPNAPVSDSAPMLTQEMQSGRIPEMIHVFLDGYCPLGHHEFADSVNNGPWGDALVSEFIPYLESRFRMDAQPRGRLLTGHSSGGWSSMWLETHYPDFFGGTWSTSPDPVDFRSFTDINLRADPPENFYRNADGTPRNLVRVHAKSIMTVEQFVKQEEAQGSYGGQFESFDAVFSPRGPDGRPMPAFDRANGNPYPDVVRRWVEDYDIDEYLARNWDTLRGRLQGKLHVWVGTADTYHLEDSVKLMQQTLEHLGGAEAKITFVPGRTHADLYDGGLAEEIAREMYAVARPEAAK